MSIIKKLKVTNPIDSGWYADPEARYYEGKYWIYATVSQKFEDQKNQVKTAKILEEYSSPVQKKEIFENYRKQVETQRLNAEKCWNRKVRE